MSMADGSQGSVKGQPVSGLRVGVVEDQPEIITVAT